MLQQLLNKLLESQSFFVGGASLALVGSAAYYLKSLVAPIRQLIGRYLFVEVLIRNEDEGFFWIEEWISEKLQKKSLYKYQANTEKIRKSYKREFRIYEIEEKGKEKLEDIQFSPTIGYLYFIWIKKSLCWFRRFRESSDRGGGDKLTKPENFLFETFFWNKKKLLRTFREIAKKNKERIVETEVYFYDGSGYWERTRIPAIKRSLIFPGNKLEEIVKDAQNFCSKERWYAKLGIPWRRGYLLYGPPGNGKTSLANYLSFCLKRPIYIMSLNSMIDNDFIACMSSLKKNAILLIEDIDAVFRGREPINKEKCLLSFSAFLNGLDGITSGYGRIVIFTANDISHLDAALSRPGRIDKKIEIRNSTEKQAEKYYLEFFPMKQEEAKDFAKKMVGNSMAILQEKLIELHNEEQETFLY